ncbi:glycosyltransferase [Limosilactobacillus fermentum]
MSESILKNKIEVSFCTVTYNSSSKIVDFVKNIESLKSNIFNKKIYVVDNGSTDGTVAIVEELCTKYDDVSLVMSV